MNAKDFTFYGEACYGRSWQAQVATHLDVDRRRISQWLKNDKAPDFVKHELSILLELRFEEIKEAYNSILGAD